MNIPIRRGTARRLGIRPPDPRFALPCRVVLGFDGSGTDDVLIAAVMRQPRHFIILPDVATTWHPKVDTP